MNPVRSLLALLVGIGLFRLVVAILETVMVGAAANGPLTNEAEYFAVRNQPVLLVAVLGFNSAAASFSASVAATGRTIFMSVLPFSNSVSSAGAAAQAVAVRIAARQIRRWLRIAAPLAKGAPTRRVSLTLVGYQTGGNLAWRAPRAEISYELLSRYLFSALTDPHGRSVLQVWPILPPPTAACKDF